MKPTKKRNRSWSGMLNYLFPTLEQANDVKRWADGRIRKLKRRKARAA